MIRPGDVSRLGLQPDPGAARRLSSALALTIPLIVSPVFAQDTLRYAIPPPAIGLQPGAQLGYSVAVDGPYTVVGAPHDDLSGRNSGTVKVFNSTTGAFLFPLLDPGPATDNSFGYSVAISGTRVIVGGPGDDSDGDSTGRAFVYDLVVGTPSIPVAVLQNPTPRGSDRFGSSVAISGERIVVGAFLDDTGATDSGSAYVYDLGASAPLVPVATLSNPDPASRDWFGRSVSISGTRVLVGAVGDSASASGPGSAYLYDLLSRTPTVPVAALSNPNPGEFKDFGDAVAVSGMLAVVGTDWGAGAVLVYDLASGTPAAVVTVLANPDPNPNARTGFGSSVTISGTRVVVGAHREFYGVPEVGSVYVYDLSSAAPTVFVAKLNNPSPASNDRFGFSVAISGTRVMVGAPADDADATDSGSAYGYDLLGATPAAPTATLHDPGPALIDQFGISAAISGTRLVVGANLEDTGAIDTGSAYLFDLSSGTPGLPVATLRNPTPEQQDEFGGAVAVSANRVVLGASRDRTGGTYAGSVYVYDLASATPSLPAITLNNPDPDVGDRFGYSVAISGNWVVVGAPFDDAVGADAGSAYVFDLTSATPTVPAAMLHNPNPSGYFGYSVAISGTRIVVGAPWDNPGGAVVGRAYVYDLESSMPGLPVAALDNPAAGSSDYFGYSVSVSAAQVVVGAPGTDAGAVDAGSVYIYDLDSVTPTAAMVTLNNPSPALSDRFGHSVAISGPRVLVGAPADDSGAGNAGGAYLYDLRSATPAVPVAALHNPTPDAGDQFGSSVAIDDATTVIGAPFDDTLGLDMGHVFVFGDPEVSVAGNAVNIVDGDASPDSSDHTDFGSEDVSAGTIVRTFTIFNHGPTNLTLGTVTVVGVNAADFSVTTQPASPVGPRATTTFEVKFDPRAHGLRSATLSFNNNDADEDPFDFAIHGVGTGAPPSRVFVGTNGGDANVCMDQTTPCRHLAAAIAQVAIDGEVIVLSSGEYDTAPIVIGKGVKITSASGTVAFIRQPILVNAPGGRVALRGLTLRGSGTGSAVTLAAADSLSIHETTMDSWDRGLDIATAAASSVSMTQSYLLRNQTGILDGGIAANRVSVSDSRFERNGTGVDVTLGTFVVRQGFFTSNTTGVSASGGQIEITRSELWGNGTGLLATSGGALRISRSHVFGNTIGAKVSGGGILASFGTNVIRGNGTDIDGTLATVPEQ